MKSELCSLPDNLDHCSTRQGFCILKGVLRPDEVSQCRDHLLGVMGDLQYLGPDGRRRDRTTCRFTEPEVIPPSDNRSYSLARRELEGGAMHINAGQGQVHRAVSAALGLWAAPEHPSAGMPLLQRFHNGDFGGRYGDELRLMVEGYVRHDPRWAQIGCENDRVQAVIEPLLGEVRAATLAQPCGQPCTVRRAWRERIAALQDFRVVYTDGAVDYPGAEVLGWQCVAAGTVPHQSQHVRQLGYLWWSRVCRD